MKNLFIIFILMFTLIGCDDGYKNWHPDGENPKTKTIMIDGCEYLAFQTSYGYWNYTLKGNGNCGPK